MKHEIEKLINVTIERLYIINECAWGKNPEKAVYTICILVDKRFKDIEKEMEILSEYAKKRKISIMFWTLCQFEKRKNAPTEEDYYIHRYGIKVYDSGKQPTINEQIKTTTYALLMDSYRTVRSYIENNTDYLMENLVRIYTLKIGYPVIRKKPELKRDCEYVKFISKDEKILQLINNYLKETDNKEKQEIVRNFENYLGKIKQIKYKMKLEEEPTMQIYEQLLRKKEKEGVLDIKTLTKEDLYIMYVIQSKQTFEIARLYGVENKIISSKRNNWGIKFREVVLVEYNNSKNEAIIKSGIDEEYRYALLKEYNLMEFEKYLFPILEYMSDNEVYLLKEFL